MEKVAEIDKSRSWSAKLVHGVNRGHINENLDGRKQEDMSLL
jgi:hypothetical protein